MEGNRKNFLNKHSNPQFKRKGGSRVEKHYNSSHEQFFEDSYPLYTIYRVLCHSKNVGSVIGKGGNIVKALREETRAQITVSDSVPGSVERVILICSPSDKLPNSRNAKNYNMAKKADDPMEPCCAAQDALLRVHDRIIREDLDIAKNGSIEDNVVTVRLLVSKNTVGCLLGRKGDVIQRLRSETGANIRVLPAHDLPTCATHNDELVQIMGKPVNAKKALYEVSALLHLNPRKDKPSLGFSTQYASSGLHSSEYPVRNMLRPGSLAWSEHSNDDRDLLGIPWKRGYETRSSEFEPENFDDRESRYEFCMKILCTAEKIGSVIGKGGLNVKLLQQETGASVHVEDLSIKSDERVIRVSSFEALRDHRSQTIEAILLLQDMTSKSSETGSTVTRLLVPSSKVGCILGQGGDVINELRRSTRADIRVFSKEDKPTCASENEELVQISGFFGAARDALTEIASRLRSRYLRDATTTEEPASVRPVPGYGPIKNLLGDGRSGFPLSGVMEARSSGGYTHLEGSFHGYESRSFAVSPQASGYLNIEGRISSVSATGGRRMTELASSMSEFHDPYSARSDFSTHQHFSGSQNLYQMPVISSAEPYRYTPSGADGSDFGHPEQFNAPRDVYRIPASSSGLNNYPYSAAYHSFNPPPGMYPNVSPPPVPYQNSNAWPVAYRNMQRQHGSYPNTSAESSYQY